MHRGINSHRHFVSVLACDLFVNFKQISVTLANDVFAKALYRVGEIEIDAASPGADTATFVANFLGRAR